MNPISNEDVPIFSKDQMFSYREEKFGYITISPPNRPTIERKILNETSKIILDECNGKNTVKDIIDFLCQKYPEVDRKTIDKDVKTALMNLWSNDIINWKTENPLMREYEIKIDSKYDIRIGFEEDTRNLIEYLKENREFESPIDAVPISEPLFIRHAMFTLNHVFFIVEENKQIRSVIAVNIFRNSSVVAIGNISNLDIDLKKVMPNLVSLLNNFLIHKRTKVRVFLKSDDESLIGKFQDAGFVKTALLKKEIESEDLIMMDYFVSGD